MNDDVCYKTKLWKFDFEVGRSFASARSPERKKKFLDIVISTKKKKRKTRKTRTSWSWFKQKRSDLCWCNSYQEYPILKLGKNTPHKTPVFLVGQLITTLNFTKDIVVAQTNLKLCNIFIVSLWFNNL